MMSLGGSFLKVINPSDPWSLKQQQMFCVIHRGQSICLRASLHKSGNSVRNFTLAIADIWGCMSQSTTSSTLLTFFQAGSWSCAQDISSLNIFHTSCVHSFSETENQFSTWHSQEWWNISNKVKGRTAKRSPSTRLKWNLHKAYCNSKASEQKSL